MHYAYSCPSKMVILHIHVKSHRTRDEANAQWEGKSYMQCTRSGTVMLVLALANICSYTALRYSYHSTQVL